MSERFQEDRARMAAEQAISSDLLDITIDGARGILFNVTGGSDLTLFEVNQAAAIIKETAHPDVNLIFGAVVDPAMKDEIRVTVIATGFERTGMPRSLYERPFKAASQGSDLDVPVASQSSQSSQPAPERANRTPSVTPSAPTEEFKARTFNTDDLDIPTFLRKRNR